MLWNNEDADGDTAKQVSLEVFALVLLQDFHSPLNPVSSSSP